jgi:hypothetical protein
MAGVVRNQSHFLCGQKARQKGVKAMILKAIPCPCGRCQKLLVVPLFHSQDATLNPDEANELVRRWNSFEVKTIPYAARRPGVSKNDRRI